MTRIALSCLLAASVAACQLPADPPDPGQKLPCRPALCASYKVDDSLTGDATVVFDAMAEVNTIVGRPVLTVSDVGDCRIVREFNCSPGGQWRPYNKEIAVCFETVNDGAKKPLLMHELFHSLGMDHVQGYGSIMSEIVGPETEFTGLDFNECAMKRVCDCNGKDIR